MKSVKGWVFLLSLLVVTAWTGCSILNNNDDDDNIVVTDAEGNILEDNRPKQWQPRFDPDNPRSNLFSVIPAYPNPSASEINIHFAASEEGTIKIGIYRDNSLIRQLIDRRMLVGQYLIVWDLTYMDGNKVIARDYMVKFLFTADDGRTVKSSGTIKVE